MKIGEFLRTTVDNLIQKQSTTEDTDVLTYIQTRFGDDILEIQGSGSVAHIKTMTEKVTVIKQEDGTFNEIITPRDSA